ncbi:MAG: hypothetical protein AB7K52_14290 [Phycisphaerales bacterium]
MIAQHAKTFGLVALVTTLIWLWAESASLSTDDLAPRLVFAEGQGLVVAVEDPAWAGAVNLRLRGSTSALDRARRALGGSTPVQLTPGTRGVPATSGTHVIDLAEALRGLPSLRGAGVTIELVDPPSVRVELEALTTVSRAVSLRFADTDAAAPELDGLPTLEPSSVSIRGPAGLIARLADGPISAIIDAEQLSRLRDGQSQTLTARVALPEPLSTSPRVSVSPARIAATVRPLSRTESWTVPTMPVWIAVPPTEGASWSIEVPEPFIRNVTITGPKDLIRAMREKGEVPVAFVDLTSDDLDSRITSKAVVFSHLPTVLRFSADRSTVALRITPREPASGSPPPGP